MCANKRKKQVILPQRSQHLAVLIDLKVLYHLGQSSTSKCNGNEDYNRRTTAAANIWAVCQMYVLINNTPLPAGHLRMVCQPSLNMVLGFGVHPRSCHAVPVFDKQSKYSTRLRDALLGSPRQARPTSTLVYCSIQTQPCAVLTTCHTTSAMSQKPPDTTMVYCTLA